MAFYNQHWVKKYTYKIERSHLSDSKDKLTIFLDIILDNLNFG